MSVRIAVIGLKFGYHHVQTLLTMHGIELVAVADRHTEAEYAGRYGIKVYSDALEMMRVEKPDAVSICTSPKPRQALIEYAATHGIAMFIEKPLASTLAQAQRLAALCEQHRARVMVGFSFRFHPAMQRLRELVSGPLGRGLILNGEYIFDWLPAADGWLWQADNGNGFFNENSCHLFDAVCHLLGEPESVMAEGINVNGSPSEEAAAITMRFASGAIASLTVGCLATGAFSAYPRINLITEHGQAHLQGREHIWESLTWATRGSDEVHTIHANPESLNNTRYTAAFQYFAECVKNKQQPSASIHDGVRAVAVAEAVYQSIRTGKKITLGAARV
jgi:predicted dehydrogenase